MLLLMGRDLKQHRVLDAQNQTSLLCFALCSIKLQSKMFRMIDNAPQKLSPDKPGSNVWETGSRRPILPQMEMQIPVRTGQQILQETAPGVRVRGWS